MAAGSIAPSLKLCLRQAGASASFGQELICCSCPAWHQPGKDDTCRRSCGATLSSKGKSFGIDPRPSVLGLGPGRDRSQAAGLVLSCIGRATQHFSVSHDLDCIGCAVLHSTGSAQWHACQACQVLPKSPPAGAPGSRPEIVIWRQGPPAILCALCCRKL